MSSSKASVLVTCAEGHEWWVMVIGSTPPQPQVVVCPLCNELNDVLLPRIVGVEALLSAGR